MGDLLTWATNQLIHWDDSPSRPQIKLTLAIVHHQNFRDSQISIETVRKALGKIMINHDDSSWFLTIPDSWWFRMIRGWYICSIETISSIMIISDLEHIRISGSPDPQSLRRDTEICNAYAEAGGILSFFGMLHASSWSSCFRDVTIFVKTLGF